MRHYLAQQCVVDLMWGAICSGQLVGIQIDRFKHVVYRRDCIVVEFQPWVNCLAGVMQPRVKVGCHNVAGFLGFLHAFFILFEQFQR